MSQIFYNDRAVYFNDKEVGFDSSIQGVEILWDNYGVPHIYGASEANAAYGLGWAQAKNHGNLLLTLLAAGRGRAAEYLGSSHLNTDLRIHAFNIPLKADEEYASYSPEHKDYIDSFVKGINDYISQNPGQVNSNFSAMMPVVPQDVLGHVKRIISMEFSGGGAIAQAGSNAYAVGPAKTNSGKAMLVSNPHLPWSDFYTFFEAHMVASGFEIYGACLVGFPIVLIGFNRSLGWTHTVNTIDVADTYELTLSGGGYILDGSQKAFNTRVVSVGVRQANGSISYNNYTIKESDHGPVLRESGNRGYAVRIAGIDNKGIIDQYTRMAKAQNLAQFENAMSMLQMSMFNVLYADKHGDIMYLFNGTVPVRSEGDWNFWQNIVDGTQSKYIWNSIHPYGDLPKLVNPSTGWLQNSNDTPWSSTYPFQLSQSSYPSYMSQPLQSIPFRSQRAINLIRNRSNISFQDLIDMKLDTGMEVADRFKSALLSAIASNPGTIQNQAATILQNWDNRTDTDSQGAILFANWYRKLNNSMFSTQWNSSNPVTTPSGLSNPSQAVSLLVTAANEVNSAHGTMSPQWGAIKRYNVGSYNYPSNGGDHDLGVFRTIYSGTELAPSTVWHGDTYVSVVEFSETVKAKRLLSYGNATQPGNPFVGSGIPDMSQNVLRDAHLDKNDVLNNLYQREVLVPS